MGIITSPIKNQIAFYEKAEVIDNADGIYYLNIEKSTVFIIKPKENSDITIFFQSIDPLTTLSDIAIIKLNIIVQSETNNSTIHFGSTIVWNYINFDLTPNTDVVYYLQLISFDGGVSWRGIIAGMYGQDKGHSLNYGSSTPDLIKIEKPIIISPSLMLNTFIEIDEIHIISDPFVSSGTFTDFHSETIYRFSTDEFANNIILEYSNSDLNDHKIDISKFALNSDYWVSIKFKGKYGGESEWSDSVMFHIDPFIYTISKPVVTLS